MSQIKNSLRQAIYALKRVHGRKLVFQSLSVTTDYKTGVRSETVVTTESIRRAVVLPKNTRLDQIDLLTGVLSENKGNVGKIDRRVLVDGRDVRDITVVMHLSCVIDGETYTVKDYEDYYNGTAYLLKLGKAS